MQEMNGPEAAGQVNAVSVRQMRSWEEGSCIVLKDGWQLGCADSLRVEEETLLVGGQRVWAEFVEAAGLAEVQKIILLDHNGVLNMLGWRQAVEVAVELDHVTPRDGGETRLLLCSYVRCEKWVQRVLDSLDSLPMMVTLDGFVFVDSRDSGNRPMVAEGVAGRPGHWIRLRGGDKSAVSRLTGKPTLLFDDRRKVLMEHSKGNGANEGVQCVLGGSEWRVRTGWQATWGPGHFQVSFSAETWGDLYRGSLIARSE